ncbi:MAG TPA: ATP-binding cassette domain-containing protein [Pseudomonadales bacterium]|jgi:putative ABC transport system ATP-binding protein|nr:ATP-binding cassette domain-containing protein [Cellvibrionales bacterium]HRF87280.1 ATP-binding cassette domain-containing protein [Pseudomonadales bacterium]
MSQPILQVRQLGKTVTMPDEDLVLLSDINLTVQAGESVAIVGTSGSGKSTLLGLLAGLDAPSSGEIRLAGRPLLSLNEEEKAVLRAEKVGFVFQNFQLLPSLTALENVMLPLELRQIDTQTRCEQLAKDFLARVGLSQRLHHYPRTLSGGEQQRVALARAFAGQPAILFADEPTGNLDSKTAHQIADLLFSLNQDSGTTLILVTHDERLAARCQQQWRMEGGQLSTAVQP